MRLRTFFISAAESALAGIAALVPVGSAPAPSHTKREPQLSCRACGTYLHGRIHYPLEFPLNHWCPMAYNLLDRWCPMEYKRIVQTVVETPTYLAIANKLFSEEERADIVALVAADPECGDLIRGTGGFERSGLHAK